MNWSDWANGCFIGVSLIYIAWNIDGILIDWIIFYKKGRPQPLSQKQWFDIQAKKEKKIAVLIPTWREEKVISQMLIGNSQHILYRNYHLFVGCYPNDFPTLRALTQAQKQVPNLSVLMSSRPGPTSKGHLLNEMVEQLLLNAGHPECHLYLFQDAEDVIHPRSLALLNWASESADFMQLPVFSLPIRKSLSVGATYMDEFAEAHTRELIVRNSLQVALPSAGVGMALSRGAMEKMFQGNGGQFFDSACLTEDYLLGINAHRLGIQQKFLCYYVQEGEREKNWIATREYFPNAPLKAIKQKARWTEGITLQAPRRVKLFGSWANRLFLIRDRKALFGNCFGFLGFFVVPLLGQAAVVSPFLVVLLICNLFLIANRLWQRGNAFKEVYGSARWLWLLMRYPLAVWINGCAGFLALKNFLMAELTQKPSVWVKTEHEIPEGFGQLPAITRARL